MTQLRVRVRAGTPDDRKTLMDFYRQTETETLPPPPVQTLANSLGNRSLLIVEDVANTAVLATGGYFDYIKSARGHPIFELAGTRVTGGIGRLSPVPLQQILLAIRLFQIATTEECSVVISSARHPKSIENLSALGLAAVADLPEWLDYDTCSWTQMSERHSWRHFIATDASLSKTKQILDAVEFSHGVFECTSERRRQDGPTEHLDISIEYDLPLHKIYAAVRPFFEGGETKGRFMPLPAQWP